MDNRNDYAVQAAADFLKAHGHGNDYVVFAPGNDWTLTRDRVRRVCHPHRGIGADGVVAVETNGSRIHLRMFNPDGGEFERSGNGLRVAAVALRRWGLADAESVVVEVGGGDVTLRLHGEPTRGCWDVGADLGKARVGAEAVRLDERLLAEDAETQTGVAGMEIVPVSVGNPHLVVFTDDVSDEALHRLGPYFGQHRALAEGANVQLVLASETDLRIRIWERGVGPTTASGTSASAVGVAAVHTGRRAPGSHTVQMDGGHFQVAVDADLDVRLRGPIQEVAVGRLTEGLISTWR